MNNFYNNLNLSRENDAARFNKQLIINLNIPKESLNVLKEKKKTIKPLHQQLGSVSSL